MAHTHTCEKWARPPEAHGLAQWQHPSWNGNQETDKLMRPFRPWRVRTFVGLCSNHGHKGPVLWGALLPPEEKDKWLVRDVGWDTSLSKVHLDFVLQFPPCSPPWPVGLPLLSPEVQGLQPVTMHPWPVFICFTFHCCDIKGLWYPCMTKQTHGTAKNHRHLYF